MTQCDRSVAMTGWHEELCVAKYRNFITFHIYQSIHHIDLDREPSGSLTIQSKKMILKHRPVAFREHPWLISMKSVLLQGSKFELTSYLSLIFLYLIYGPCWKYGWSQLQTLTFFISARRRYTADRTKPLIAILLSPSSYSLSVVRPWQRAISSSPTLNTLPWHMLGAKCRTLRFSCNENFTLQLGDKYP